jgi:ABC-type transport system involved in multi-copper enzyme maturation permease subunit
MRTPATRLLVKDELVGFAKSKVMIVLWVALPVLATLGYFLLPSGADGGDQPDIPLTYMMGILISSLAGTIAAVMVAVDIVSEKSRKVYELFIIRPIAREAIVWAKFLAVFLCVTIACVIALCVGIAVDLVRGVELEQALLMDTLRSLGSVVGVIAVSAAVGVFFGVLSSSILVAVILILYVGQNLAIIPMLPAYLNLSEGWYWIILAATALTTLVLMYFAGVLFRRAEY